MTDLLINLLFIVFGSVLGQIIAFTQFSKKEIKSAWFGWTIVVGSLIFGLVPGFTNEFVFWMSEAGLILGILLMGYTIFEKDFLPKSMNKIVYFYPTLPKIKLCCRATK